MIKRWPTTVIFLYCPSKGIHSSSTEDNDSQKTSTFIYQDWNLYQHFHSSTHCRWLLSSNWIICFHIPIHITTLHTKWFKAAVTDAPTEWQKSQDRKSHIAAWVGLFMITLLIFHQVQIFPLMSYVTTCFNISANNAIGDTAQLCMQPNICDCSKSIYHQVCHEKGYQVQDQ